ncbi:MAG: serine/threonine protein kinase [Phycisphaeraceae bacterium]|nr:serine/threonine protein kinase [Phycisphaeraceae bacterium]
MSKVSVTVEAKVSRMYRDGGADPALVDLLQAIDPWDDDALSELIEVDGRLRISLRRPISMVRYLEAVPDLPRRELPLDSAIDVVLRSMSGGARPTSAAVAELKAQFPEMAVAIDEAAVLGRAVVSTTGVSQLVRSSPQRVVPDDFGPIGEDGVPRYQLVELLGSGSSGEVYLAVDRLLSEQDRPARVAIKILATQVRTTRAKMQLAEEASKARRVLHDHVVRVLDRGLSDEGEDYIVYEHVEGGDLDRWLEAHGPRVAPAAAATMVAKVARGLQAAHLAGLVHCDLKPSNILVTSSGEPKVADFGIAVRESELVARREEAMQPMGNIAFISPEQYRGEPGCLGVQSDVYALGGVLFYLLTGELPNGSTVEEVARTHDLATGRPGPPDPRLKIPRIDDDLAAICRRAMASKPADRHASAGELADDLEAWVRHEPIAWRRPSVWRVARLATRRRPALVAAIAVAFLSVVAGAGAAGYWVSVAKENRARADAADATVSDARNEIEVVYRFFKQLQSMGMGQDMIQMVVAWEQVTRDAGLDSPQSRLEAWRLKTQRARDIVKEYIDAGREDHVETLMWQGVLGFWLVNNKEFDEAAERLGWAVERWRAKGLETDALAEQTRRLWLSARALQLHAKSLRGELTSDDRSELLSLNREVGAALKGGGLAGGLPTRERLLEAQAAMYSPALLDRPREHADAQAKLDQHRKLASKPLPQYKASRAAKQPR